MTVDLFTANIKRGLAIQYLADLTEWMLGDHARFSRMVDGRGAGIGSPESWLSNLRSICANPVVVAVHPTLPADVAGRLATVGLTLAETT